MRARTLLRATVTAAGLLLAGCGGADGDAAGTGTPVASAPAGGTGGSGTGATGSLEFPDEFGLPTLTVPDGAQVVDYSVTDDLTYDVLGLDDVEAVLDSMQAELEAAGLQVVRTDDAALGTSITAEEDGAGTVLVSESGEDSVTVIARPPA